MARRECDIDLNSITSLTDIVNEVFKERARQEETYGIECIRGLSAHDQDAKAFGVLLEEMSEAKDEVIPLSWHQSSPVDSQWWHNKRDEMEKRAVEELIQVAACAFGICEGIMERRMLR